jgi:XTP/dITP diphosphohydrolase
MRKLILATSNLGKLKEFQNYLTGLDWVLELKPETLDVEETGDSFMANACLKATTVATTLKEWAIADDSGLMVDALNGRPGIYSARYGKTDLERIERLLAELGTEKNRQAHFVCALVVASPDGSIVLQVEGVCTGEILFTPQGDKGFGYDPIFYLPEYEQTFAQMSPSVKRQLSHRGKAFNALLPQLKQI